MSLIQFGMTKDSCTSITTWHKTIGSKAMMHGLKWSKEDIANRVSLQQGSIGAIEQRFEMNIKFDKISDIDLFFGAIPGSEHVKWGKQHANYIVQCRQYKMGDLQNQTNLMVSY